MSRDDWMELRGDDAGDVELPPPPPPLQEDAAQHRRWVPAAVAVVALVAVLMVWRVSSGPDEQAPSASPGVTATASAVPVEPAPTGFPTPPPTPSVVQDAKAIEVASAFEAARRHAGTGAQRETAMQEVASLRLARTLASVDPSEIPELRSEIRLTGRRGTETMLAGGLADGSTATYIVAVDRGRPRVVAAGRDLPGQPSPTVPAASSTP